MRQAKADVAYALSRSSSTVRRVPSSDERVNTLQELRFGTKESRQGLAVSETQSRYPQRQKVEKVQSHFPPR